MRLIAALVLALVALAPVSAQERGWPPRAPFTPGPPVTLPECTCRAEGRDLRLGETVCLKTARGERLATCEMVLNNTSWRVSDVPCATSSAPPRQRVAAERM